MHSNFVHALLANWNAECQAHEIAVINAQITTRTLSAQLFFRFSPIISLFMGASFKARLGVISTATAALYANQGQHTRDKHTQEAFEILSALPRAEEHLTYVGRSGRQKGIFQLVFTYKPGKHLFMPIKFVPEGRAPQDECWVRTAYVIDERELQRRIRRRDVAPQTKAIEEELTAPAART